LKINQVYEPLPEKPPSGYRELLIARDGITTPKPLTDPEGNRVLLVPKGMFGIERIGIRLGVRDVAAHRRFYVEALGLTQGETTGKDGLVTEVDREHGYVLAHGGREARAPVTLGTTARVSMVRDPDGNWIELSQRASLTGSLEPGTS
jgi:lactoylglutathione lyase